MLKYCLCLIGLRCGLTVYPAKHIETHAIYMPHVLFTACRILIQ